MILYSTLCSLNYTATLMIQLTRNGVSYYSLVCLYCLSGWRCEFLMILFPSQVCLVMEYAEGGSLYNGKSTCCNREQHSYITNHGNCSTLLVAKWTQPCTDMRSSPVQLTLPLFACSSLVQFLYKLVFPQWHAALSLHERSKWTWEIVMCDIQQYAVIVYNMSH